MDFSPTFYDDCSLQLFIKLCNKHKLVTGGIVSVDTDPLSMSIRVEVPDDIFVKEILWPEFEKICQEDWGHFRKMYEII